VAVSKVKLTKKAVEAAAPRAKQYSIWCSELPGFGIYIQPTGHRTYFVDYRNVSGTRRRLTLGRHGQITTEAARKLAILTMGKAAQGDDPADTRIAARKAMTVRQLCDAYLDAVDRGLILGKGGRPKRPSTIYTDRGRIARHILPLLGSKLVQDLQPSDIHRFIRDVSSGKTAVVEKTATLRGKAIVKGGAGTAARTSGLLGSLLSFAVSEGIIPSSPSIGVKRPADNRRTRRLSAEEYVRMGKALAALEVEGRAQGSAAVRLIALTGCRSGEIINLRRDEVDSTGCCLRLSDSKEGASVRPIGEAAMRIIRETKEMPECPYVLTPLRGGQRFGGLPGTWGKLVEKAKLDGVTPHTLRHSFASVAADMGFTESTIAAMLGHQSGSVTSRYIHHLDSVLLAAADKVASQIDDWFVAGGQIYKDSSI
jgi:integrase